MFINTPYMKRSTTQLVEVNTLTQYVNNVIIFFVGENL